MECHHLKETIKELIPSGKEGDYWGFRHRINQRRNFNQ